MKSPLSDEMDVRHGMFGRAERVVPARLRGDFAQALSNALLDSETPRILIAVRPDKIANVAIPACVIAATERALILLREPPADTDIRYGIRVLVVPYRRISVVELGDRLLRGTFKIAAGRRSRHAQPAFAVREECGEVIEVLYHALDEPLFVELWRTIREGADL